MPCEQGQVNTVTGQGKASTPLEAANKAHGECMIRASALDVRLLSAAVQAAGLRHQLTQGVVGPVTTGGVAPPGPCSKYVHVLALLCTACACTQDTVHYTYLWQKWLHLDQRT